MHDPLSNLSLIWSWIKKYSADPTYTGEIIYSEKIPPSNLTNGTFEINLQFLPKGNYILFTDVNGKGNGTKIVIQ